MVAYRLDPFKRITEVGWGGRLGVLTIQHAEIATASGLAGAYLSYAIKPDKYIKDFGAGDFNNHLNLNVRVFGPSINGLADAGAVSPDWRFPPEQANIDDNWLRAAGYMLQPDPMHMPISMFSTYSVRKWVWTGESLFASIYAENGKYSLPYGPFSPSQVGPFCYVKQIFVGGVTLWELWCRIGEWQYTDPYLPGGSYNIFINWKTFNKYIVNEAKFSQALPIDIPVRIAYYSTSSYDVPLSIMYTEYSNTKLVNFFYDVRDGSYTYTGIPGKVKISITKIVNCPKYPDGIYDESWLLNNAVTTIRIFEQQNEETGETVRAAGFV